jgi:hypothetical protein
VEEEGGMGEARAAAPAPGPWQPAGVRRTPQAPCPSLSLCSGRKREEELGEKEMKAARGRADVAAPLDPMSPADRLDRRTGGTRRAGAAKEGRPWRIQEQHVFAARPALLRRRTEETAAA